MYHAFILSLFFLDAQSVHESFVFGRLLTVMIIRNVSVSGEGVRMEMYIPAQVGVVEVVDRRWNLSTTPRVAIPVQLHPCAGRDGVIWRRVCDDRSRCQCPVGRAPHHDGLN